MADSYLTQFNKEAVMLYSPGDQDKLQSLIRRHDAAQRIKWLACSRSALGGEDRASLFVKLSLQNKEDWKYGLYENSPCALFAMHSDGRIELISNGLKTPKFRKRKVKSLEHIAKLIVDYVNSWGI